MAKKKAKKRRSSAPGVDAEEKKRERLEARRREKEAALAAQRRAQLRRRLLRNAVLAAAVAGLGYFLFFRGAGPDEIDGHPIERLSSRGAGDHRSGQIEYESTPPVSGPHSPLAAACGVHAAQIANEQLVHTLEHGAVGIQYRPDLDREQIRRIEEIVRSYDSHVFSHPYAGMDSPVVVSSWSRMMKLDEVDEKAIRDYIREFKQNGAPEDQQECAHTADQSLF